MSAYGVCLLVCLDPICTPETSLSSAEQLELQLSERT